MAFVSLGSLLPTIEVAVDATTNPTAAARVWTDITPNVRQLSFSRSGRNQELNRSTAGSLSAVCSDAAGAITGLGLRKRQWIRVRAQWLGVTYARWQGVIETLPRKWPGQGADQLVEFHAVDVFKVLGLTDLSGQTYPAQRNDQRVSSILALANLAAGAIDTNTDAADAVTTPFADQSMALDYLLQIEDSENGLLIANPDGTVDFQGRHWRYLNAATPVATFDESGATIPYFDDVEYDDDDSLVRNIAAVTPFGASSAIVVTNTASTARYWPTRFDRQLLSSNVQLAQSAAEWLTNRYGDPAPRVPAITCELAAVARKSTALVATLLAANDSSRFTWNRAASTPLSVDVYVEQIVETIDVKGGSWQWKAQLSPADDNSAWVLGTSQLGVTTGLAY
jgi:hypothetical protein